MPELPEVETIRRELFNVLLKKMVSKVEILSDKTLRVKRRFFIDNVLNFRIVNIKRIGKLLLIFLDNEYVILIHLKMTGQLIYKQGNALIFGGHEIPGENQMRFTRAILYFKDGAVLFFNDLRKFGYIDLVKKSEVERIARNYGPDPTSENFNFHVLKKICENRRAPIKAVLLNQKLIAGIGNIYADESCFAAGILPSRPANSLTVEELKKLARAIKQILKKAISQGGTTFRDYKRSTGKKGNYSDFLQVYGRNEQPCYRCGNIILKSKVAGRGTCFCPNCQK